MVQASVFYLHFSKTNISIAEDNNLGIILIYYFTVHA